MFDLEGYQLRHDSRHLPPDARQDSIRRRGRAEADTVAVVDRDDERTRMFVQVFQGRVKDADLLNRQFETWLRELKPKTTGYLGSTSGITPDGQGITVARFDSEDKARADSDLPEQGAWWEETSKAFDGEATFHDCPEVDEIGDGPSADAGFVQVIQGRVKDKARMRSRGREMEPELRKLRPDVLGGLVAWHSDDDAAFTQIMYFTNEQDARTNEHAMADSPLLREFMSMMEGDLKFYDLEKNLIID